MKVSTSPAYGLAFACAAAAVTSCGGSTIVGAGSTDTGGASFVSEFTGGHTGTGGFGMGGAGVSTGGVSTGGGSTGGVTMLATPNPTLAEIKTFIESGSYRKGPWKSETATPRAAASNASPHGTVRVWFNDALQASTKAGNGGLVGTATPHTTGSMAVKEMYVADKVVGRAVMLKKAGMFGEWAYYCDGPQVLCGGPTMTPFFGIGPSVAPCAFCHGGYVFTPVP